MPVQKLTEPQSGLLQIRDGRSLEVQHQVQGCAKMFLTRSPLSDSWSHTPAACLAWTPKPICWPLADFRVGTADVSSLVPALLHLIVFTAGYGVDGADTIQVGAALQCCI